MVSDISPNLPWCLQTGTLTGDIIRLISSIRSKGDDDFAVHLRHCGPLVLADDLTDIFDMTRIILYQMAFERKCILLEHPKRRHHFV
jgi:hypothetical protein